MKPINLFKLLFISLSMFSIFAANAKSDFLPNDILAPWEGGNAYYAKWKNGPSSESNYFPIAVWWQDVSRAAEYKKIGINYYLYLGIQPKASQLATLAAQSIDVACVSNEEVVNSPDNHIVRMWMNPRDEQDNALKGTTTPVPTSEVLENYEKMKNQDLTRPVYLPLGQGAATDLWYGRGDRTGHPEDYVEYAKGADIMSFDVYPMNITPAVEGAKPFKKRFSDELYQSIWYVAKGVDNLRKAADYKKPVWVWLECTNYYSAETCKLTPNHTKAEAWMAIIHGARGIGYFCHILKPKLIQDGLLTDTAMTKMVASINKQITDHAQILNTQSVSNGVSVKCGNSSIPIDVMVKRFDGYTYIYAVAMRPGETKCTLSLRDFFGKSEVEVVGENRILKAKNGKFQDDFSDYNVHIYRVKTPIVKNGR
ncbi:MAG: hypothetical protein PHV20_02165 [Bacteroidales bacterium]|nr:hypothetical protein [Bacteroidales bacterium]